MAFAAGLVVGLALGLIVIGFLAAAAYQRGYEEAIGKRRTWRAELVARRAATRVAPAAALKKAS
jgi:hypothetical protein